MARSKAPIPRMVWLKWALCAAMLSTMAFSPHLWVSDRAFPTIPAIPGFPVLPQAVCLLLTVLLMASLGFVAVHRSPGRLALIPAGLWVVLVLFDTNRLQPACYQYAAMFCGLSVVKWDDPMAARSRTGWAICAIALVGVYVWSGIQKLNMGFADFEFPWLIEPLGKSEVTFLKPFWIVAPIGEILTGLLLLIPRTRLCGLAGSVFLHGFLLWMVGPFGHDFNSIIWPWNFWVPIMAFLIFFRNPEWVLSRGGRSPVGWVFAVLFGAMPLLNFFGLWDGFLSASFYSGKLPDGWFYFTQEGASHLPAAYKNPAYFVEEMPGRFRLDIIGWAMKELNGPPYAELRVYAAIGRRLVEAGVPRDQMQLLVRDPVPLTSSKRTYSVLRF